MMSRYLVQSMFSRALKGTKAHPSRFLSTPNKYQGTKIGYECLAYSDLNTERSIITKSLAQGCKTIVTKSRPGFVQTYELLCDLTEDDECEPSSLLLGHICANAPSVDTWTNELEDINFILKTISRPLNFITIPLTAQSQDLSTLRTSLKSLQDTIQSSKGTTRVGLDINTAYLMGASAADVSARLSDVLVPLAASGHLQALSVASNVFTYAHSKTILVWAASHNISSSSADPTASPAVLTVATDALRSHARKPGQLQSDYSYNPPHHMGEVITPFVKKETSVSDMKVSTTVRSAEVQGLLKRVAEATDNLNVHLNKCLHVEKTFIGKITPEEAAALPRNEVLLGHMLSASHSQIKYPEEWQFYLRSEIEPKLEDALKALKGRGTTHDDFASLYKPMTKNLLSSFRHLLQEIALLRSQEVLETIHSHTNTTSRISSASSSAFGLTQSLPETLAKLALRWTGAHFVTLPHTTVDVTKWGDAINTNGSTSTDIDSLYEKIRVKLEEESK